MHNYSLQFEDSEAQEARIIRFRGNDAHRAFAIMEREQLYGPAKLFANGKCLGQITLTNNRGWILKP